MLNEQHQKSFTAEDANLPKSDLFSQSKMNSMEITPNDIVKLLKQIDGSKLVALMELKKYLFRLE